MLLLVISLSPPPPPSSCLLISLTFYRDLQSLGNGDHDISSKHPEDVVKKQPSKKEAANAHRVQRDELNGIHTESQANHIVKNPLLKWNEPKNHITSYHTCTIFMERLHIAEIIEILCLWIYISSTGQPHPQAHLSYFHLQERLPHHSNARIDI